MENKVDVFKALGDKNRLRILNMLSVRELCVCEINAILNVSMSTISSHLKILRNAGLVKSDKDGRWIIYSLDSRDERISELVKMSVRYVSDEPEALDDVKRLEIVTPENCTV